MKDAEGCGEINDKVCVNPCKVAPYVYYSIYSGLCYKTHA